MCPEQDWDFIVADWANIDIITELASGDSPNQQWFLALLYLLAGECVRTEAGRQGLPHLQALLDRLEDTHVEALARFRRRALRLLAAPSTYEPSLWRDDSYAHVERDDSD